MGDFERPPWSGSGEAGTALILPGASGGVFQSVIYWVTLGLADAGWNLLAAQWSDNGNLEADVQATARAGLAQTASAPMQLVVGKSLGSLAAPVIAEAHVAAVWLTPLLDRPEIAAAIDASGARALAIGGTADATWQQPEPRDGLDLLELPDANHGLIVPGDWRLSLSYTERIVEQVIGFASDSSEASR